MLSISAWGYNVYVALCPEGQACALGMQIASWLCVAQAWWFWTPVSSVSGGHCRELAACSLWLTCSLSGLTLSLKGFAISLGVKL